MFLFKVDFVHLVGGSLSLSSFPSSIFSLLQILSWVLAWSLSTLEYASLFFTVRLSECSPLDHWVVSFTARFHSSRRRVLSSVCLICWTCVDYIILQLAGHFSLPWLPVLVTLTPLQLSFALSQNLPTSEIFFITIKSDVIHESTRTYQAILRTMEHSMLWRWAHASVCFPWIVRQLKISLTEQRGCRVLGRLF